MPSVEVMVKTSMAYRLTEGVKVPAVQLPVDQQDTLHTAAPPFDCRTPAANSAKTPSPHTGSAVADAIEWETTTTPATTAKPINVVRTRPRNRF